MTELQSQVRDSTTELAPSREGTDAARARERKPDAVAYSGDVIGTFRRGVNSHWTKPLRGDASSPVVR